MSEFNRRGFRTAGLVARLADEGVPILAIARATQMPLDDIRRYVEMAFRGREDETPPEDWAPDLAGFRPSPLSEIPPDAEAVALRIQARLGWQQCQSRFLALLVTSDVALARDILTFCNPGRTMSHDSMKVHAHKVRRKLDAMGIDLKTVWGRGYRLVKADRDRVGGMLDAVEPS